MDDDGQYVAIQLTGHSWDPWRHAELTGDRSIIDGTRSAREEAEAAKRQEVVQADRVDKLVFSPDVAPSDVWGVSWKTIQEIASKHKLRFDVIREPEPSRQPTGRRSGMVRPDELVAHVEKLLKRVVNEHIEMKGGEVGIRTGSTGVTVRVVPDDPPLVAIFAPLLRKPKKSPKLFETLNDINRGIRFARVFLDDETVVLVTELLAGTLDEEELARSLELVASAADYFDTELKNSFGGETLFDDSSKVDSVDV